MKTQAFKHNLLGMLALASLLYCLGVYLYIQPQLTPAMLEPTRIIQTLGNFLLLALPIVGFYHLFLLWASLQTICNIEKNIFIHSLFVALVILSGITLLSDLALLSDIGKEYTLWDVQGEWQMLYGFTVFQLLVTAGGLFFYRKGVGFSTPIFSEIQSGSDVLFLALHQIGAICGGIGILMLLISFISPVPERYKPGWMLILSALALFPWGLILFYWVIRNRKKALNTWFDEKQMSDTGIGALAAMLLVLPLAALFAVLSAVDLLPVREPFWFALIFFTGLLVFSTIIAQRNKMS